MKAFFIALGVGITAYCFLMHLPMWLCVVNLVLDVLVILQFIKSEE